MAEFRFVMRQWRRMCDGVRCDECILRNFCDADPCSRHDGEIDVIEDTVLQWAAEHPEPIYPTWWKYMCMIGVIPDTLGDKTLGEVTVYRLMNTYIPADIAQKLGLTPKDG